MKKKALFPLILFAAAAVAVAELPSRAELEGTVNGHMIRDNIDNVELTDEWLSKHSNEADALNYLFGGLEFLYRQVDTIEVRIRQELDPNLRHPSHF